MAEPRPVHILFFGRLGDRFGRQRVFDLADGGWTIAELRRRLSALDADHAELLDARSVRACLDGFVVPETTIIGDAREIAFIPPLSGG